MRQPITITASIHSDLKLQCALLSNKHDRTITLKDVADYLIKEWLKNPTPPPAEKAEN